MTDAELDFYDALTRYVEDQSIKAAHAASARGRALGFTMAMLQRRFASSVYAVRRSLERMKDKREKILADPEGYRQEQLLKKVPDNFDDLTEEEQDKILEQLEDYYQEPCWNIFDMFAGTSTGSIIAGALAAGRELRQVIALYTDELKAISVIRPGTNAERFATKVYANVLS